MGFHDYSELIDYAQTLNSEIDQLRLLQYYFLKNVRFRYFEDIASALIRNDYDLEKCTIKDKTQFDSKDEKKNAILEFEGFFGENFRFDKESSKFLLEHLGKVTETIEKKYTLFGKEYISYEYGCDGSISSWIAKEGTELGKKDAEFENGLLKEGVCRHFANYVKKYCDDLGIKCSVADCNGTHKLNIINIEGKDNIFDYTKMLSIRDDFLNTTKKKIDDFFNMTFEKMYEYYPNRKLTIDNDELTRKTMF